MGSAHGPGEERRRRGEGRGEKRRRQERREKKGGEKGEKRREDRREEGREQGRDERREERRGDWPKDQEGHQNILSRLYSEMEVLNLLAVEKNSVPSHHFRPYANDAPKKTIIGTSIASNNEVHAT